MNNDKISIDTFKDFNVSRLKFVDFETNYKTFLDDYLDQNIKNAENIFVEEQIASFRRHHKCIVGAILGIDVNHKDREEYLQFLRNRILFYSFKGIDTISFDSEDNDNIDLTDSERQKEFEYFVYTLNGMLAVNNRIINFLEFRQTELTGLIKLHGDKLDQDVKFVFKNNFDSLDQTVILEFFKQKLVKSKYLKNEILESYLTLAFDKREIPEVRFNIDNLNTKDKIIKIFYEFYKVTAGKPRGKQIDYAKLLGEYFTGFDTKTVSSNFSK